MSVLRYKDYTARIEFDAQDKVFTGRLAGINDVIGFHGESVAELEAAFHEAVEDYIDLCAQTGKPPEKPFSGRVMFRVDPATHAQAALAAQFRGLSLNQWAEEALLNQAYADLAALGFSAR